MIRYSTTSTLGTSLPETGLLGWLEQTRVRLPLRAIDCRFDICGEIAEVETCQVFVQENAKVIDCVYVFALPGGAAIHRCVVDINGRRISAKAEERGKARKLAAEKKAAGHRTALVECERDNVFTLTLGNAAPGDIITVRLAWFQVADRLGAERSLLIPFTPGIRFIPGSSLLRENRGLGVIDDTDEVPDASRITPPRIDASHPDAAGLFIHGTIRHPGGTALEVASPTDLLRVIAEPGLTTVEMAGGDVLNAFPDTDFVLRWRETCSSEGQAAGSGWARDGGDGFTYALVHLVAPVLERPTDFAQDLYFLVDRSGSMDGRKWEQAVKALHAFVDRLGDGDRVFLTFFENGHKDFAEKPLAVDEMRTDANFRSIGKLGTGGGTDLLPALRHQLEQLHRHSADRPASIILITDGQVGNESEILKALEGSPELRLHTFGIDTNVNDAFLRELSRRHRGTCCLRTPDEDIAGAIDELGASITRPALRSLSLESSWESPGGLPTDLYSGQSISLPLRRKNTRGKVPAEIVLEAKDGTGQAIRQRVPLQTSPSPAVSLLWVRERIDHLLVCEKRDEAIDLAVAHNLICEGVAFVAWDEAEKLTLSGPVETLVQPSPASPSIRMASSRDEYFACAKEPNFFWPDTTLYLPAGPDPERLDLVRHLFERGTLSPDEAIDCYFLLADLDHRVFSAVLSPLRELADLLPRIPRVREDFDRISNQTRETLDRELRLLEQGPRRQPHALRDFFNCADHLRSIHHEWMSMADRALSNVERLPASLHFFFGPLVERFLEGPVEPRPPGRSGWDVIRGGIEHRLNGG